MSGARGRLPPVSRTGDIDTSHEAEESINVSGSRVAILRRVLQAVQIEPGLTRGEYAEKLGLEQSQVWRRLSDLKNTGHVVQGDARVWIGTGRRQATWWPSAGTQGRLI